MFENIRTRFAFHNYDDLRSLILEFPPPVFRLVNGHIAETWGGELPVNLQALEWWRLRGGYTYLRKDTMSKFKGKNKPAGFFLA
jgi:iron complex outermembrane receptor protein